MHEAGMPEEFQGLVDQAEALAADGMYPDAINTYEEAIRINPDDARLHHDLALVYEEVSSLENAELFYKAALRLRPNFYLAYFNLGLLYVETNEPNLALMCFEQCLEQGKDPTLQNAARSEISKLSNGVAPGGTAASQTIIGGGAAVSTDKEAELEEIIQLNRFDKAYRGMQGTLRAMGLFTLLLGALGLVGLLANSLNSLSLIIIGLAAVLLPIRANLLALAVQYSWICIDLAAGAVLLPEFGAPVFLLPAAVGLVIFLLVLYFRYRSIERPDIRTLMEDSVSSMTPEKQADSILPWLVFTAGLLSLVSFIALIFVGSGDMVDSLEQLRSASTYDNSAMLASSLTSAFAVSGLAFGVSAVSNNRKLQIKTLIGMIFSGIILLMALSGFILILR